MALPRPTVFRTLFSSGSPRIAGTRATSRLWQRATRRTYASEGAHGSAQTRSDLPWLLGSVAVTAPSAYFLIQSGPGTKADEHGHGHGHGHGKEEKGHKEESAEEAKEESGPEPETETHSEEASKEESEPQGSEEEQRETSSSATADQQSSEGAKDEVR